VPDYVNYKRGDVKDKSHTLFLAEDDEDDRLFFSMAVAAVDKELKLIAFNDGVELISYLDKAAEIPNILFLDINMPKLSGLECLEEIRNCEDWKDIPVAMYSTSGNENDIERSRELGAQVFIMKPFQLSKLAEIIDWALSMDWEKTVLTPQEFFIKEKIWQKKT